MRSSCGHLSHRNYCLLAEHLGLRGLELAVSFGQLFRKRASFFANLRRPQGEAPAAGDRAELLDLRAEPLRFTGLPSPHNPTDANAVRFQAYPIPVLMTEGGRDSIQQPFKLRADRLNRPIADRSRQRREGSD